MKIVTWKHWIPPSVLAAAALTILLLSSVPVMGQARGPAPASPAGPFTRTADGKPDLNGYWGGCCNLGLQDLETQRGIIVEPANGKIPYNPQYGARAADLRANHMFDEPGLHCLLEGVPFQMFTQFGFQILQVPNQTLIAWDFMNATRIIAMDSRPHIPDGLKLFMGDSIGHWEGDVLVVDTTNLNDLTWLDAVGHLHSDVIHVVERFTPIDANTIRYEATVDDPKAFTQSLKLSDTFRRNTTKGYQLMEFACLEGGDTDLQHYTEAAGAPSKGK